MRGLLATMLCRSGRDPECGSNIVVHEFAHQLDFLDKEMNGTPLIEDPELDRKWRYVMFGIDRGVPFAPQNTNL